VIHRRFLPSDQRDGCGFVELMRAREIWAQLPSDVASPLGLECRLVRIGERTWSKRRRFPISSL
jgi:hypothetical protein